MCVCVCVCVHVCCDHYKRMFSVHATVHPPIAQLVERWTVVVTEISIGHWFESGLVDVLFFVLFHNIYLLCLPNEVEVAK